MTKAQRAAAIESLAKGAFDSVNAHTHFAFMPMPSCPFCRWLALYRHVFGERKP